ncbi:MAG: phosphatase PAP2 family protein [bacterium]|nr:phosphatase PAP2 family protein [bacterium]
MTELEIVSQLQHLILGSPILIAIAVFCARYLIAVFFVIASFLYYSRRRHEKHAVMEAIWAVLIALLITNSIGTIVDRLRPFQASWISGPLIPILIPQPLTTSFPSGHTAVSFALAFAIFWGNRKWGIVAFVTAGLIGLARILVGVHYPSDVAVGIVVGFVGFLSIRYIHKWLK